MTEIFNFDANGELVEKFEHVLRQHNHELSAAEFHGTLTGLVCAGHSDRNIDQWQTLLVADRCHAWPDGTHQAHIGVARFRLSADFLFWHFTA